MLVVHAIAAGQARYYLDGPAAGSWIGGGAEDLGLRGTVDDDALHSVLAARRPGGELLPTRVPKNRRAGFDLILAAPKSLSLLAAMAEVDADVEVGFVRAHREAVGSTIGYLERNATWARRGAGQTRVPTSGLVAASFTHDQSGAADPHLHSHVVVANLVRGDDGRWSAMDSRSLFRHARPAGAVYQATLRHHLAEQGLRFSWTVSHHGLGDIAGVPRSAIEAASVRSRQVAKDLASGSATNARARQAAVGRSRHEPAGALPWQRRVAATGFNHDAVGRLIDRAAIRMAQEEAGLQPWPGAGGKALGAGPAAVGGAVRDGRAIEAVLTEQHSRFRRADVVRAAAIASPDGASAQSLEAAAEGFLRTAVHLGNETWTTTRLRHMEGRIVELACPARAAGRAVVPSVGRIRPGVAGGRAETGGLAESGQRAAERLTGGGASVDLLGGEFLSQAALLDAARIAWEADGHRVAVLSPTERSQGRWRALVGLDKPTPSSHATVVLVDNADRWLTNDLYAVMADAAARRAKVVLIDGGTRPRRRQPESPAMEKLRGVLPAIDPGPSPWAQLEPGPPRRPAVVQAGRDGSVNLAFSAAAATAQIVDDWQRQRAAGTRPRMVALGASEAELLNTRAREALVRTGEIRGPAVEIGGRAYQAGDEVAALARDARLGAVKAGTLGRVVAVDAEHQGATIEWEGHPEPVVVDATRASGADKRLGLTHGYATTPSYLRAGRSGRLLSLGDVQLLAPRLRPDQIYEVSPSPAAAWATVGRSSGLAAVRAEAAGTSLGGPPPSADVSRTLGDLTAERDRLARLSWLACRPIRVRTSVAWPRSGTGSSLRPRPTGPARRGGPRR